MRKAGKIITSFILIILTVGALGIVVPNLFGIKTMAVLSGSMEPAYPTGSMVYAVPTSMAKIKKGDVISFVMNIQGTIVTHRVVEVDGADRKFIVKGDANQTNDANQVSYDNVLGVVRFHIPVVGYILGAVITRQGKIIAGTVIIAVVILILLFSGGEKQDKEKRESRKRKEDCENGDGK